MRPIFPALFSLFAMMLVGCSSPGQQSACYQAITADDGAVVTTTALYREGLVSRANAESAYTLAATAEAPLYVWAQSLVTTPSTTQPASVTTALANLEAQLQVISTGNATVKERVRMHEPYGAKVGQVSPTEIIAIIQLVSALEPGAAELLNSLMGQSGVTNAQISAAMTQLNSDLAALQAALANPSPALVPAPAP